MGFIVLDNLVDTSYFCIDAINSCAHHADMSIHKRIKDLRIERGLSMHELAIRCGYKSWQTVQQWEKEDNEGGTAPKRTKLLEVANVLGTTAEYLSTGEGAQAEESLTFADLSGMEAQLIMFYRAMSEHDKHELEAIANKMANGESVQVSAANPYPSAPRVAPKKGKSALSHVMIIDGRGKNKNRA